MQSAEIQLNHGARSDSRLQGARRHELGDEDKILFLWSADFPVVKEADNIGMLEILQHLSFLAEPLPLSAVQLLFLRAER